MSIRAVVLSLFTGVALSACGLESSTASQSEQASHSQIIAQRARAAHTPDTIHTRRFALESLAGGDVGKALGLGESSTASFGDSDSKGYDVLTTASSQFPTEGNSYVVLSSGCASSALSPNTSGGLTCDLGGLQSPSGQDMVQLTVDTSIPPEAQCWLVDWKFFSDEFPEYVGTAFNDAFLIEVGSSAINVSGLTVTAPNNVAYDASGKLISINTTGSLGMSASKAEGTTYDGATDQLTTRAPLPKGASSLRLIFTVLDVGDSAFDSAAFIDNIRFSSSPCGEPETQPGPQNALPSVTVAAPSVTVEEGAVASLGGTYADANAGDIVTLTASAGGVTQTGDGAWTWSFDTKDGPAQSQTITVTAVDSKGGTTTTNFSLNISNAAPQAFVNAPTSGSEGKVLHLSGSSLDPSPVDTAAGHALSWLVTKDGAPYTSGTGASLSFTPEDNGSYEVVLTAQDKDGATGSQSTTILVANTTPTAALTQSASSITEGAPVKVSLGGAVDASPADVAAGLRYEFACGGALGPASYETSGTSDATVCTFADNGTYTLHARVLDKDGGFTDYASTVVVNNVAPAITSVVSPSGPLMLGTAASVNAAFTDPGVQDTHTCAFSWDDGTASTAVASASGGSGSCSATRTYTGAGVYTVKVSVLDKDGGTALAHSEFVVIYDPDGGFVTGGGWFLSPVGASSLYPDATGKAHFGFVSKYKKGATIPTGETEFQFKAGNLNFHSDVYEWLVVAGARAQYKGTGKINNAGEYGFLITAVDGQVTGGNAVDQIRIKIWNKQTGAVVYDNRRGQSDDMDAVQPQALGGGSIVIHK